MAMVGVLALQGSYNEHISALRRIGVSGVEVRKAEQLQGLDSLIIPGGESTTMAKLANYHNLELIKSVEQSFDGYDVDTLVKVFITLQSVMIEVMKVEGDNTYKMPHIGKDKLQKEGKLPMVLKFDGECYWKSLEIIADHAAALAQQEEEKMKGKQPTKASKRKAQVIVGDKTMIPVNTYETWLKDPSSLVRKRRRVSSKSLIRETKIREFQATIASQAKGL